MPRDLHGFSAAFITFGYLGCVAAATPVPSGAADKFAISQDGTPVCQIVAAPEVCTESDTAAALELRGYLKKITGVEIPIYRGGDLPEGNVIIVGKYHFFGVDEILGDDMTPAKLGKDGYIIRRRGNRIILFGQGWYGPFYAVYAFLEQIGCRFYGFSEVDEVIPKIPDLAISPRDTISRAAFIYRDLLANGYVKQSFNDDEWARWRSWQIKTGQGGQFLFQSHNFYGFCPPSKYFKSHPEYFALVDGKRRDRQAQLCWSNPNVVKLAVDAAGKFLDRHPYVKSYSLTSGDWGGYCECSRCAAMGKTIGEQYAVFVNRVARELKKTHPDRLIAYIGGYNPIPDGPPEHVRLESNVLPIQVNYTSQLHDLNDDSWPEHVQYKEWLKRWQKNSKQWGAYEWIQLNPPYDLPSPQTLVIGDRIKYYHKTGCIAYEGEVCGITPPEIVTIYIAAKLLWNPEVDPKEVFNEYLKDSFGPAAGEMKSYFQTLFEVAQDRGIHYVLMSRKYWTPEVLSRLRSLLRGAIERAGDDSTVRARIDRYMGYQKYLELVTRSLSRVQLAKEKGDSQDKKAAMELIDATISHLASISDQGIVTDQVLIARLRGLKHQLR